MDLTDDPDGSKTAAAVAIVTSFKGEFPQQVLKKIVSDKQNPDNKANTPAARDIFRLAEQDHNAGMFLPREEIKQKVAGTGFLGFFSDTKAVPGENPAVLDPAHWRSSATKEVRDAEAKSYADYLTKMRAYFEENPKATDTEANDFSQSIKRPYILSSVSAALTAKNPPPTGSSPKSIASKADFDALPSGARFIFNGKPGVKK
jgi:hypothetical protein